MMNIPANKAEILPEITRRILSVSSPDQIILFGSYARGDFNPNSDLDLLIILPGMKSSRSESTRLRRALRGLLVPVDIIVVTPQQIERFRNTIGYIFNSAISEGKVIYERPAAV